MRGWFSGRARGSSQSLNSLEEPASSASHIMNDDMELAESELSKENTSFHKLGLGLLSFLKAVLGFERELMAEAQERLNAAETQATESYNRVKHHSSHSQSQIYSPGSEFLLCQAQVQIMGAVIGVLTESVTESLRGFYKLRKAYLTLDVLLAEENAYLKKLEAEGGKPIKFESETTDSSTSASAEPSRAASTTDLTQELAGKDFGAKRAAPAEAESDADEFFEAAEVPEELPESTPQVEKDLSDAMDSATIKDADGVPAPLLRRLSSHIQEGPDAEIFTNSIDAFVHSSSNLCYGMLLLLLSMLPPAFNTLTKIAGFKGDRRRGIALLWQASKFGNLNGAFAGLVVLGYYNGFIGFCDILPETGSGAYPKERCQELLETSRKRYPKSGLWMLEEIRSLSNERRLEESLERLKNMPDPKLKQMVKLNNWSHGLYYYIAACAHIERYRELLPTDPEKAAEQAEKVTTLFTIIPNHIGKKRIMAKQMPFDVFVARKLAKWTARAAQHSVPLIDAVGVSPLTEMVYFWNGFKRMGNVQLEKSLVCLGRSQTSTSIPWETEDVDEKAILSVMKGVVHRHMGKTHEARVELESVTAKERTLFKGGNKDNWVAPAAHYEMGVAEWVDYKATGDQACLEKAQKWLEVSAGWEAYDLDARVGIRVKTGLETVKREKGEAV
ncbi:hypothetical protein BT63DRAFT_447563 [Microthyrium microscopicum]|uniref:Inclusion body clearance protein IML2 n=1 Tax=Microthyrium microscopicum TaxID=703497 RepID=A0A6A6U9M0_9PEZI|nr:hypothetical protein BT63DRAFT_447563 [Microthyrium microscopicum]